MNRHGELTKVDYEGVPKMVQNVRYLSGTATIRIRLFNGEVFYCEPSSIMRYPPGLMAFDFTPEQLLDAYVGAEIVMEARFNSL